MLQPPKAYHSGVGHQKGRRLAPPRPFSSPFVDRLGSGAVDPWADQLLGLPARFREVMGAFEESHTGHPCLPLGSTFSSRGVTDRG